MRGLASKINFFNMRFMVVWGVVHGFPGFQERRKNGFVM